MTTKLPPGMRSEWALGDGYFYKHSVVRCEGRKDGLWMMAGIEQELVDALDKNFVPRADDVILATFPKSGTTWVQAILSRLLQTVDAKMAQDGGTSGTAGADQVETKPVPTASGGRDVDAGGAASPAAKKAAVEAPPVPAASAAATAADSHDVGVFVGLDPKDRVPWFEGLCSVVGAARFLLGANAATGRRAFKTHAPLPLLRSRVVPGVKVIFVTRNPKDVCVSMWHHTRSKNFGYDGPFNHFARELFLRGRVESGDWFKYVTECHRAGGQVGSADEAAAAGSGGSGSGGGCDFLDPKDVLLLRYEHMLGHPQETVATIAAFLGIPAPAETVAAIAEATSFSSMSRSERKDGCRLPGWPHRKLDGLKTDAGSAEQPSALHCRKGGAGGWRDYFLADPTLNAEFDRVFAERMAGTGITFDFGGNDDVGASADAGTGLSNAAPGSAGADSAGAAAADPAAP